MSDQPDLKPQRHPDRMSGYWKRQWPVLAAATVAGILFNGSMSLIPVLQGLLLDAVVYAAPLGAVLRRAALFLAAVLVIQIFWVVKRYALHLLPPSCIIHAHGGICATATNSGI